jgi:hypothetical protein
MILPSKVLAILMPRHFMQDELGISVLSYIAFVSCSYAFLVLNCISSVLEKFRNSKLVISHTFNWLNLFMNDYSDCHLFSILLHKDSADTTRYTIVLKLIY